jgi:hypothetical protein
MKGRYARRSSQKGTGEKIQVIQSMTDMEEGFNIAFPISSTSVQASAQMVRFCNTLQKTPIEDL